MSHSSLIHYQAHGLGTTDSLVKITKAVLNDPNVIEVALDIYLVEIKITANSCPIESVSNYHNRLEPSINT